MSVIYGAEGSNIPVTSITQVSGKKVSSKQQISEL